ncbi:MAG: hypothetical protein K2W95_05330 [Candidatus Obscuribacterales bacterium]|nr:hypothetical protein [Candidatus Obscuribacterales bacterium]
MPSVSQSCKLGELLMELGMLKEDDLKEVMQLAMQINLPLGRALILSNRLKEEELKAVLQLQHLLRTGTIDMETARQAFNMVQQDKVTIAAAIEALGKSHPATEEHRSKIASFLIDTELVAETEVVEAQRLSYESGTPVGRMLVLGGAINHNTLARAIEYQVLVREGKMAYGAAVNALKTEGHRELPIEENAKQHGLANEKRRRVRLGELLMLAGLLTENDLLNVIEVGLTKAVPLGEVVVSMGIISKTILEKALELQSQIENNQIDVRTAAELLQKLGDPDRRTAKGTQSSNDEKTADGQARLGDLLQQSGLVNEIDIEQAIDMSSRYPTMLGKMLVVTGAIDEGTLLAALRCQYLVRNRMVPVSGAVKALQYAQRHRISLDDALEDLDGYTS